MDHLFLIEINQIILLDWWLNSAGLGRVLDLDIYQINSLRAFLGVHVYDIVRQIIITGLSVINVLENRVLLVILVLVVVAVRCLEVQFLRIDVRM